MVMVEAVLEEVDTYKYHLQNIIPQFMVTRMTMDLCLVAERRPGERVDQRWREHQRLDL